MVYCPAISVSGLFIRFQEANLPNLSLQWGCRRGGVKAIGESNVQTSNILLDAV